MADHSIVVTPNVKNSSIRTISKQISRSECFQDVLRISPIRLIYRGYPQSKRGPALRVYHNILLYGLLLDQMNFHKASFTKVTKVRKMRTFLKNFFPAAWQRYCIGNLKRLYRSRFNKKNRLLCKIQIRTRISPRRLKRETSRGTNSSAMTRTTNSVLINNVKTKIRIPTGNRH